MIINSNKYLNFDDPFCLFDTNYKNLIGLTRTQHDHILTYIPPVTLKNAINRSPRCALACLLIKLRLGINNTVLASMLGIRDRRKADDILNSVRLALMNYFVPHYLGLAHITWKEVIQKRASTMATQLLAENRNPCILVLDGMYLYIQVRWFLLNVFIQNLFFHEQKSCNNEMQSKIFNLYKAVH